MAEIEPKLKHVNRPKKIAVLGDVMLDINYFSDTPSRTAPESPSVGVHKINHITHVLGGAANVAAALADLGCEVYLFGITGTDFHASMMDKLLTAHGIHAHLTREENRHTTQKHRKFTNNVLDSRFDVEDVRDPEKPYTHFSGQLLRLMSEEDLDAVVFSDYDKGFLTEDFCQAVILSANARGIYTFVDPKLKNYRKYRSCFCFKPNAHEARELTKIPAAAAAEDDHIMTSLGKATTTNEIENIVKRLYELIHCNHVLLTDGANGLFISSRAGAGGSDNNTIYHIKHTEAIDVRDVTGAGDVVMVAFVYTFLWKNDLYMAARVANLVGGKSVKVLGNYRITREVLENFVGEVEKEKKKNRFFPSLVDVGTSPATAAAAAATTTMHEIRKQADETGATVVFTNGCFDILHSAHLRLLNFCKSRGDVFVVGVNSDESVRRLKGPERPINDVYERTAALRELRAVVDHVVVFEEDTPARLIEELRPDVLIKGGDYTPETVVGAEHAGRVEIFDYVPGKSTTNVLVRARRRASRNA